MAAYTTDQEQLELLRNWFKKYGLSIVLGIVFALILNFGWRYWQQRQQQTLTQASVLYEQMLEAQITQQTATVQQTADTLMQRYAHTPYAAFAAMMLAKNALSQNNLAVAQQKLEWVVDHANPALQPVAKIRLARVLLAQQKPQEALSQLQHVGADTPYNAAAQWVRGDAYAALHQTAQAQLAYQAALASMPKETPMYSVIQMKLDALLPH